MSAVTRGWSHSWVGRTSVVGTGLLALGGFTLSFAALRDLAVRVGMPSDLGWIWPLLIDGMIVEATLAVVALAQRGSRAVWYAWFLLAAGALVSVGSNGAHAVITGHGWAGAAAASVPPVVLLATTHLTVLLMASPESSAVPALAPATAVGPGLHPGPDGGGYATSGGDEEPAAPAPADDDATAASELPPAPASSPSGDGAEVQLDSPVPAADVTVEQPAGAKAESSEPATSTQDRDDAVEDGDELSLEEWVAQCEAAGQAVTGAMVAERFGVSPSTGRRRLAALRKARQPHLRLASNE